MSSRYLIIAAVCVLGAAGLAQAQAPATAPSPAEVVKARQSALMLSAANFGAMKHLADGPGEVKDLAFNAAAQRRWANTLPTLFPAGSGPGQTPAETKAKAEIWTDRPGFEKAAADYQAATAKLLDLAKANDKPGFVAQWEVTRQTCNACHTTYRAK